MARAYGRWKPLESEAIGAVMRHLSDAMVRKDLMSPGQLPYLGSARTLLIASDFSGSRNDRFEVYSFLVTGNEMLGAWLVKRRELRARHLPDGRRMSYKGRSDRIKRAALLPFLMAADTIPGLVFSVAVDTRIPTLFPGSARDKTEVVRTYAWKPEVSERLLRVVHFVSFLIGGLSRAGQDVLWVCDEDAILANDKMGRHVAPLLRNIASHYLSHGMGHFRFGTTASDPGDRSIEDLVAIPDLAAGGVREALQAGELNHVRRVRRGGRSSMTMTWLACQTTVLAKRLLVFRKSSGGGLTLGWLRFPVANSAPSGSTVVDIDSESD